MNFLVDGQALVVLDPEMRLVSVVLAALRGAHGAKVINENVSFYYLADEVCHTHRGLTIATTNAYWEKKYADLTPAKLAQELLRIARAATQSRYQEHPRGPKKKTKPMSKKGRRDVSTAQILAAAKT